MELSGATTANWVAKSANLLVDSLGQPLRVGVLLPLHWHAVVLLLAGVSTGATVVLAGQPGEVSGCDAAFVLAEHADAVLAEGVPEVLALSAHPLGLAPTGLPAMVPAYAGEVPTYADHYSGPRPGPPRVEARGAPVVPLTGLSAEDRVLTARELFDPGGAAVLLGALTAGASLVLLRAGDPAAVATAERATVTAGTSVPGLTSVG